MSMFSITSASVALGARGGPLERVEVDADEVDELDVVLGGRAQVLGVVAQREDAGVELGVERLDAPVHHLRPAGEVVDRAHVQPGRGQLARGAAGRDQLDPELREPARELDDPALVGDRQQRPAHLHRAGLGDGQFVGAAGCAVAADGDGARIPGGVVGRVAWEQATLGRDGTQAASGSSSG